MISLSGPFKDCYVANMAGGMAGGVLDLNHFIDDIDYAIQDGPG